MRSSPTWRARPREQPPSSHTKQGGKEEQRTETQIIWLRDTATSFSAQCEHCHYERAWPPVVVRGALCPEADVGFITCWRGHRIRVRRFPRIHVQAASG